jgi:hypothetical protein
MRPRAAVRDVEVITAGLRLEAGRAVRGNPAAKTTVAALKLPALARLLVKLTVSPDAVD